MSIVQTVHMFRFTKIKPRIARKITVRDYSFGSYNIFPHEYDI
jgi:hypothetical protein